MRIAFAIILLVVAARFSYQLRTTLRRGRVRWGMGPGQHVNRGEAESFFRSALAIRVVLIAFCFGAAIYEIYLAAAAEPG